MPAVLTQFLHLCHTCPYTGMYQNRMEWNGIEWNLIEWNRIRGGIQPGLSSSGKLVVATAGVSAHPPRRNV